MIEHLIVAHPDAAPWIPYAQKIARALVKNLEERRRKIGSKRQAIDDLDRKVYIDIRVQAPNVWIYLDINRCPAFVSGLYWVKDFFNRTATVDGVERFQTLFPKKTPTVEVDQASLASQTSTDQLVAIRGSMYSGEMRKVVQVLMGMGAEVPYDYRASRTHGVFVASDGARWILKISSEGLVAYRMTTCRGKNTPEGLGYTPLPTAEPEHPIVLLTEEQIAEIMEAKGAFFVSCGWAFSETGHKLANCFVGSESVYSYSWQYEITVTEDDEGAPASASFALLEEGYIHGHLLTHMKYPTSDNLGLYSFNPYRGNANYVHECIAPVFCYYEGESLETYFYVYNPAGDDRDYGVLYGNWSAFHYCSEFENVLLKWGNEERGGQPAIKKSKSFVYSNTNFTLTSYTHRRGEQALVFQNYNPSNGSAHAVCVQQDQYQFFGPETGVEITVLVVPTHEREACYLIKKETNQTGGFFYKFEQAIWEYQTLQFEITEHCDVTASPTPVYVNFIGRTNGFVSVLCDSGILMESNITNDFGYPVQTTGIFQTTYQASPGQTADCTPVEPSIRIEFPAPQGTIPVSTSVMYSLALEASGNVDINVAVTDNDAEVWLVPIDGLADQVVRVERDAFAPTRGAYTTLVNKIHGHEMTEFPGMSPYDLATVTGSVFGFVGAP